MKYNYRYFKDGLPEWKRKKDPILSRIFYRKASFLAAALCANIGISANTVSYASSIVAVAAAGLFLVNVFWVKIIAAVLVNVWLLMDCIDGNLARCVKSQPFGEFADSASSYILVALLGTCMGYSVYQTGGLLFAEGSSLIILIGALASTSDTLMRLVYQKYKATAAKMEAEGKIPKETEKREDTNQVGSFRVRVESELGIGGVLPILVLVGTILNMLDIVVIYCIVYYGLSSIAMILLYTMKAIRHTREYENTMTKKRSGGVTQNSIIALIFFEKIIQLHMMPMRQWKSECL